MRQKTSLTLDPDSIPLARERAKDEGLDVGRWVDRAIRQLAAQGDEDQYRRWRESWSAEDQAVEAALAQHDAIAEL